MRRLHFRTLSFTLKLLAMLVMMLKMQQYRLQNNSRWSTTHWQSLARLARRRLKMHDRRWRSLLFLVKAMSVDLPTTLSMMPIFLERPPMMRCRDLLLLLISARLPSVDCQKHLIRRAMLRVQRIKQILQLWKVRLLRLPRVNFSPWSRLHETRLPAFMNAVRSPVSQTVSARLCCVWNCHHRQCSWLKVLATMH